MKKRPVIINFPAKLPILSTVVYSFLLYYFKVDGIWWGIFIAIYTLYWAAIIVAKCQEEYINLNDDKVTPKKSAFAARLDEMAKQRSNQ